MEDTLGRWPERRPTRRRAVVAGLALAAIVLAGCAADNEQAETDAAATASSTGQSSWCAASTTGEAVCWSVAGAAGLLALWRLGSALGSVADAVLIAFPNAVQPGVQQWAQEQPDQPLLEAIFDGPQQNNSDISSEATTCSEDHPNADDIPDVNNTPNADVQLPATDRESSRQRSSLGVLIPTKWCETSGDEQAKELTSDANDYVPNPESTIEQMQGFESVSVNGADIQVASATGDGSLTDLGQVIKTYASDSGIDAGTIVADLSSGKLTYDATSEAIVQSSDSDPTGSNSTGSDVTGEGNANNDSGKAGDVTNNDTKGTTPDPNEDPDNHEDPDNEDPDDDGGDVGGFGG